MNKRFIAGAVCPSCAALDRLVIFKENGLTVRECVACGFTDTQNEELEAQSQTLKIRELKTRVNGQTDSAVHSDGLIPIKNLN